MTVSCLPPTLGIKARRPKLRRPPFKRFAPASCPVWSEFLRSKADRPTVAIMHQGRLWTVEAGWVGELEAYRFTEHVGPSRGSQCLVYFDGWDPTCSCGSMSPLDCEHALAARMAFHQGRDFASNLPPAESGD